MNQNKKIIVVAFSICAFEIISSLTCIKNGIELQCLLWSFIFNGPTGPRSFLMILILFLYQMAQKVMISRKYVIKQPGLVSNALNYKLITDSAIHIFCRWKFRNNEIFLISIFDKIVFICALRFMKYLMNIL